ncbi:MAG TPA: hypothetical protein VGA50_20305 [Kiloniellales bacterium]
MIRTINAALLTTALLWAGSAGVHAQGMGPCLPHAEAVAKLTQRYSEHQVGIGLGTQGDSVVELYVADTGTWTILITHTNGISCIGATGNSWTSSPLVAGDAT